MFLLFGELYKRDDTLRLGSVWMVVGGSGLSQMGGTPALSGVSGIILRIIRDNFILFFAILLFMFIQFMRLELK